jgi:hypothetical protein
MIKSNEQVRESILESRGAQFLVLKTIPTCAGYEDGLDKNSN